MCIVPENQGRLDSALRSWRSPEENTGRGGFSTNQAPSLPSPEIHSNVQTEINPVVCQSTLLLLILFVHSPPPVLHPFPQAHITRNPITSHEGKPSLMTLLLSHFNFFLSKALLFLISSFYFFSQWVKEDPQPLWAFAPRRVTLSYVSVPLWPLLSGHWVPGFLCIPTLNSGFIDNVPVALSRFFSHAAGEAWMRTRQKRWRGWLEDGSGNIVDGVCRKCLLCFSAEHLETN